MNQLAQKSQIPWWLTLIIVIETLPMFLGPIAALNNPTFMGGPSATEVGFSAWIYTARNVAVGIAFIVAYCLRNAPMLFILIVIRLLTDLVDGPAFLLFGMASNEIRVMAIFLIGYYIPALIALRYLWKQMTASER
ncbi:MAG: hypothetical protein CBB81_02720 [Cellvibrionales bacterium TMED21]|jgi:hypothetical protein|nr:hypothetical protein [Halieaceae bacterium]OUT66917.1 MAG: hypothetical protein CBB81_02720 [Cellvibrionales bacterium TMED21]|tara:strand:+ start:106 stop:513 length:408 start_codon:yes stop_codon:yes gene_type:complete